MNIIFKLDFPSKTGISLEYVGRTNTLSCTLICSFNGVARAVRYLQINLEIKQHRFLISDTRKTILQNH